MSEEVIDYDVLAKDICNKAWETRHISNTDYDVLNRMMAVLNRDSRLLVQNIAFSVIARGIVLGDPFID